MKVEDVVSGLERPTLIANAGDGTNRIFIGQQIGIIRVIQDGTLLDEPFLDISDKVTKISGFSEQGLIGFTFHPDYKTNGKFYVQYSNLTDASCSIVEYTVLPDNPNVANPASARIVIQISQSGTDHNGGQLAFGPDGYLYIGKGDGSGPADSARTGQNTNVFNGKILRINVNKEGAAYGLIASNPFVGTGKGANEVWAYGLRNPYTFSFDTKTGDLYIADVGESQLEELNFLPASYKGGAPNFGWSSLAGREVFNSDQPVQRDMIAPIVEYKHDADRCAIIGGRVYRGKAFPQLQGVYLYADWCSGIMYYLYQDDAGTWNTGNFIEMSRNITGIGVDENQEIYMVYYRLSDMMGGVMRLVPGVEGQPVIVPATSPLQPVVGESTPVPPTSSTPTDPAVKPTVSF